MNKEQRKKFWDGVLKELDKGIDAICLNCEGNAKIYPGGLFCPNCSPPEMLEFVKIFRKTNSGYERIK